MRLELGSEPISAVYLTIIPFYTVAYFHIDVLAKLLGGSQWTSIMGRE